MKKRITRLNPEAKTRLRAVEEYLSGKTTYRELGEKYGVHQTTIREWCLMYEAGGVARLKTYMKPRPVHVLDLAELEARAFETPGDEVILSLLDLARGAGLNDTAAKWGISPQGLAKRRRKYLKG